MGQFLLAQRVGLLFALSLRIDELCLHLLESGLKGLHRVASFILVLSRSLFKAVQLSGVAFSLVFKDLVVLAFALMAGFLRKLLLMLRHTVIFFELADLLL